MSRATLPRPALSAVCLLIMIAGLAGGLAIVGGVFAARGLSVQTRVPATARLHVLALRRHAEAVASSVVGITGVRSSQVLRFDELFPEHSDLAPAPERISVIGVEVDLGAGGSPLGVAKIRELAGVVDVVDQGVRERERFNVRAALAMLTGGVLMVSLGACAYSLGLVGAARIAARSASDEIVVRHLLGAEPRPLWMPLAMFLGAAAVTGVLVMAAVALLATSSLAPEVIGGLTLARWLPVAVLAWLAGTAALSAFATRHAVLRIARTALTLAASFLLGTVVEVAGAEWHTIGYTAGELHRVGRELAAARRAVHRTEQSLVEAERIFLGALSRGDAARSALARVRWRTQVSDLARWQRRCRRLRERQEDLRHRQRAARLGPPIEPRVVPVLGEVAVPFDSAVRRSPSAAFRHGIGLRVSGGETIVSTAPGRVAFAGPLAGVGSVVVVDHGRRIYSVYGRIGVPLVAPGEEVASGAPVARAPERPSVLYFSVRQRGRAIDPLQWIHAAKGFGSNEG